MTATRLPEDNLMDTEKTITKLDLVAARKAEKVGDGPIYMVPGVLEKWSKDAGKDPKNPEKEPTDPILYARVLELWALYNAKLATLKSEAEANKDTAAIANITQAQQFSDKAAKKVGANPLSSDQIAKNIGEMKLDANAGKDKEDCLEAAQKLAHYYAKLVDKKVAKPTTPGGKKWELEKTVTTEMRTLYKYLGGKEKFDRTDLVALAQRVDLAFKAFMMSVDKKNKGFFTEKALIIKTKDPNTLEMYKRYKGEETTDKTTGKKTVTPGDAAFFERLAYGKAELSSTASTAKGTPTGTPTPSPSPKHGSSVG